MSLSHAEFAAWHAASDYFFYHRDWYFVLKVSSANSPGGAARFHADPLSQDVPELVCRALQPALALDDADKTGDWDMELCELSPCGPEAPAFARSLMTAPGVNADIVWCTGREAMQRADAALLEFDIDDADGVAVHGTGGLFAEDSARWHQQTLQFCRPAQR